MNEILTGTIEINEAVSKSGKKFHKITINDKFLYDWNKVCLAVNDGDYVNAEIGGKNPKFPELKKVSIASKQTQVKVTDAPKVAASVKQLAPQRESPALSKEYLCLKLATELATGQATGDELLQYIENCYKKIKSLWEDE